MRYSWLITLGLPQLIIGLLTIPLQQKHGLDWVPWAQAGFGLTLVVVGIILTYMNRRQHGR